MSALIVAGIVVGLIVVPQTSLVWALIGLALVYWGRKPRES